MTDALVDLTGLSRELVEVALEELSGQPKSLAAVRDKPAFLDDTKKLDRT
jgi:hypothetical protein